MFADNFLTVVCVCKWSWRGERGEALGFHRERDDPEEVRTVGEEHVVHSDAWMVEETRQGQSEVTRNEEV